MLQKLQRKTLIPAQIIAYLFTLLIGATIILITIQFYADISPILSKSSDVFNKNAVVVSKNISILKSINKDKIYFSDEEIEEFKTQSFVKDVAKFQSASFEITAYLEVPGSGQSFYTDLFFESIPDRYLDILPDDWKWEEGAGFVPIIIPEAYLNLYNFGFAESQNLPVISGHTISQVGFNLSLSGNYKRKVYRSRIVGLSDKINSILVPEDFLRWANNEYGGINEEKANRILVEFTDASDSQIPLYLQSKDYNVSKQELEYSKLIFFFKTALLFVGFIAIVIILLSSGFILLSINLITQKNKELLLNLYNIGYSAKRISRYYQVVVSTITSISIVFSVIVCYIIRSVYLDKFKGFFELQSLSNYLFPTAAILLLLLVVAYNVLLLRNVRKIVS